MARAPEALDDVKTRVAETVDRLADDLERLSHRIHANPELAFKEEKAARWLTEFLEQQGAQVERGVGGLPTAFRATIPGRGPGATIAIMAEYDALPNIGHACGHNVIATAGTGAGAAIAAALGTLPFPGRIQVIGTPRRGRRGGQGQAPGGRRLSRRGRGHDEPWSLRNPGVAPDPRHHQGQMRVLRQGLPRLVVAVERGECAQHHDP